MEEGMCGPYVSKHCVEKGGMKRETEMGEGSRRFQRKGSARSIGEGVFTIRGCEISGRWVEWRTRRE